MNVDVRRLGVELALAAVMAALAGLAWSAVLPLRDLFGMVAASAVVSTLVITVLALRPRPGALRDLPVSAVGYIVVAGLLVYRSTTFLGLPTLSTVRAIGNGLVNGWAHTLASSVPAPPVPSIRLVPFTVAWLAALWGATLTIRSRSVLAPGLVAVGGFGLGVLLSGGSGLLGLAGALVASLVMFTVVRVSRLGGLGGPATARRASALRRAGDGGDRRRGGGGGVAALVLVSGVRPARPVPVQHRSALGADAAASDPGPGEPAQAGAHVRRPGGSERRRSALPNFRLSVLDHFDGSQWSSTEKFVEAASVLPPAPATSAPKEQSDPRRVRARPRRLLAAHVGHAGARVAADRGAGRHLGLAGHAGPGGDGHALLGDVDGGRPLPRPTPGRGARPVGSGRSDPAAGLGRRRRCRSPRAQEATAGATGADAQLSALQRYLTSAPFHFSFQAPAGQSYARIRQFLTTDHAGTSEQFATAFALMARSLGLPTRVVAGFRHGALKDGAVSVTSTDAYAWTEVHLAGLGWVSYDSTPFGAAPVTPPSTTPGTTVPEGGEGQAPGAADEAGTASTASDAAGGTRLSPRTVVAFSLMGLVVLIVVVLPLAVLAVRSARTRRRRRAPTPEGRTLGAWRHAVEPVRSPPGRPLSTLTVAEITAVADDQFGEDLGRSLGGLGAIANRAQFDPRGVAVEEADAAWAQADSFRRETRRHLGRGARLVAAVDPRTLRS